MSRAPDDVRRESGKPPVPPADFARLEPGLRSLRVRGAGRVRAQLQPQSLQVQGVQRQPPRAALVWVVMVFLLSRPGRNAPAANHPLAPVPWYGVKRRIYQGAGRHGRP
jgi:hypothetical protein